MGRACVWLMLVGVWLWRGSGVALVGWCPGRVLPWSGVALVGCCCDARGHAVSSGAGGARVSVASRWALRSGSCRLGCALVGAASYTNGLGMALLSPSRCAARPASAEADARWVWIDTQSFQPLSFTF